MPSRVLQLGGRWEELFYLMVMRPMLFLEKAHRGDIKYSVYSYKRDYGTFSAFI